MKDYTSEETAYLVALYGTGFMAALCCGATVAMISGVAMAGFTAFFAVVFVLAYFLVLKGITNDQKAAKSEDSSDG